MAKQKTYDIKDGLNVTLSRIEAADSKKAVSKFLDEFDVRGTKKQDVIRSKWIKAVPVQIKSRDELVRGMKWRASKPGKASKARFKRRKNMVMAVKFAEWTDKNATSSSSPAVGGFYDHMNQVKGKDRTQVKKELKKRGLMNSPFIAAYFR